MNYEHTDQQNAYTRKALSPTGPPTSTVAGPRGGTAKEGESVGRMALGKCITAVTPRGVTLLNESFTNNQKPAPEAKFSPPIPALPGSFPQAACVARQTTLTLNYHVSVCVFALPVFA